MSYEFDTLKTNERDFIFKNTLDLFKHQEGASKELLLESEFFNKFLEMTITGIANRFIEENKILQPQPAEEERLLNAVRKAVWQFIDDSMPMLENEFEKARHT